MLEEESIAQVAQLVASGGVPNGTQQLQPESQTLREALMALGVPASAIVEESGSKTTRDQAVLVGPLLLTIVPWTIRNAVVYRELIPIDCLSMQSLWQGNNPDGWNVPLLASTAITAGVLFGLPVLAAKLAESLQAAHNHQPLA